MSKTKTKVVPSDIPRYFDGIKTKKEVSLEIGFSVRKIDYWIARLRESGIEVKTRSAGRMPLEL
jgi:hypothetical protein